MIAIFCSFAILNAQQAHNHLADSTVLVVRHAEKPATGASLTHEGFARAKEYARYFHPFVVDGAQFSINALYAGSDEPDSIRPRLTLEPLSQTTGVPLNTHFSTTDSDAIAHALVEEVHKDHVLIAWRHKKIPALLKALGADIIRLLPDGEWPDSVYDWAVFLHFDAAGHLGQQRLIHEPNPLPKSTEAQICIGSSDRLQRFCRVFFARLRKRYFEGRALVRSAGQCDCGAMSVCNPACN